MGCDIDSKTAQEFCKNCYKNMATAKGFQQVYPNQKKRARTAVRFGIWVNSWKEMEIEGTADITAVQILPSGGRVLIFIIYNSCKDNLFDSSFLVFYFPSVSFQWFDDGSKILV